MFGLAWTEIALIGVVAMVLIGPKDLPVAIRAVADVVKKARRMAGEFQVHVDDMMRDSNLREVRDSIAEIRRMDITGEIRRHVDADGSLHAALTDNPFQAAAPATPTPTATSAPSITGDAWTAPAHAEAGTLTMQAAAPSFIPPAEAPAIASPAAAAPGAASSAAAAAPSFIPPGAAPPPA